MQRIYPFHWSLEFAWVGKISAETIVGSFFDSKHYWRYKEKEVDFLDTKEKWILPIEVKEGETINNKDLSNLIFFMKKFNLKEALLVYNGDKGKVNIEDLIIRKIPFWKLFLG